MNNEKEISFGAFDSELMHQEIFIPEGFEATIDGNKIILKKKESKDERIRKELIGYFTGWSDKHLFRGFKAEQILTWLEKQGEHKKFRDSIQVGDEVTRNRDGVIVNLSQLNRVAKKDEQKLPIEKLPEEMKTIGESLGFTTQEECDEYNQIVSDCIMSDNKGEPKFKVGDWVVCEVMGSVSQIKNCIENLSNHKCGYDLTNGGYICSDEVDHYHLWTIQDAKNGDVLCDYLEDYDNPLIFILKKFEHVNFGLVKPSDYSSYCFLTAGDRHRFKEGTYHHEHNIKPATKEQRNLLFQKMKEAGYEWDDEKKELRKMGQKSKWTDEDECHMRECILAVATKDSWSFEEKRRTKHWLKSLKQRMEE
jgi:hypothetical protein